MTVARGPGRLVLAGTATTLREQGDALARSTRKFVTNFSPGQVRAAVTLLNSSGHTACQPLVAIS